MKLYTNNTQETEALGKRLAEALLNNLSKKSFIALYGDMGVGKTSFTRGFCSALSINETHSPTYTIVNEYRKGLFPVFHFDMYRIESEDDLVSIDFYGYLEKDGFCICEWSENIADEIPDDAISVTIKRSEKGDGKREIIIEGGSAIEDFIS